MLTIPERVLHGAVPHLDIAWLYGPGAAWVPAAVYKVFGVHLLTGRFVGLTYQVAVILSLFALGLRWSAVTAVAGAFAAILVIVPEGLTPLPWNGALALALWALVLGASAIDGGRAAPKAAVGSGLLVGFALLFRPDFAIGAGAMLAVLYWRSNAVLRRRVALGLAAGLAPFVVHIVIAGPSAVWRGLVIDPLQLRGGNYLPVPPRPSRIDGFLQQFVGHGPPWPFPKPTPAAQLTLWFFLLLLAVALPLAVGVTRVMRTQLVRPRVLLACGGLIAGLLPTVLQRDDALHLSYVGSVAFACAVFAGAELTRSGASRSGASRPRVQIARDLVTGVVTPLVIIASTPSWTAGAYLNETLISAGVRSSHSFRLTHQHREYYLASVLRSQVESLLRVADATSHPGDRLFVGPRDLRRTPYNDSFLYYLLPDLVPATRFLYMNPSVALDNQRRLARDVASADVVILSEQWSSWREPNDSRRFGSGLANRVVRNEFCPIVRRGPFTLLRRC
jgi:hypothetical protein